MQLRWLYKSIYIYMPFAATLPKIKYQLGTEKKIPGRQLMIISIID